MSCIYKRHRASNVSQFFVFAHDMRGLANWPREFGCEIILSWIMIQTHFRQRHICLSLYYQLFTCFHLLKQFIEMQFNSYYVVLSTVLVKEKMGYLNIHSQVQANSIFQFPRNANNHPWAIEELVTPPNIRLPSRAIFIKTWLGCWINECWWHIIASVKWVIVYSGNDPFSTKPLPEPRLKLNESLKINCLEFGSWFKFLAIFFFYKCPLQDGGIFFMPKCVTEETAIEATN